ncbi:synaptic vesicle glycoprotein 2B [Oncorhynchus clarkii lewisi]|uniref:synaptic vesicle glycoprotein 2B n=1 Tax=Oncorhynchus clarkii lewisi TaxID=490388 RepID=UPI0039B93087
MKHPAMSRHIHIEASGDDAARVPLLTSHLELASLDSDEGEVIFERCIGDNANDVQRSTQRKRTYEEAVEEAGFGLFHGLLLVVCGWANASDAVEILCVSFLLPTARCDLHLSSSDMGLLTANIFLGMMIGGYMWGYLADQRGRQKVLVMSLTVNGVFGALASFAPRFWLFLLLRFISGVGVGGSIPVIFSYFSEFQPRLKRGAMISALATFWMAGNILAAGLAWLVIPRTWVRFSLGGLDFQSWRLFVVLCSVPSLTSALIFSLAMPESPRFLMEAGRETEALRVFCRMFAINHRGSLKTFSICGLHIPSEKKERETRRGGTHTRRFVNLLKQCLAPIRQLFVGELASRSVCLVIIFYCISFGYYGLWMWFPELFKRAEDGGSPCANVSRLQSHDNQSCYPVKTAVYMEGFVTAASNLPGNIFTVLLMDVIGGKALLCCSLLLSSVSVFLIYEVKTKAQSLLISCVFSGVSVVAWNSLDVLGTELYPTQLRSSALGFFTGIGRVAAIMGNIVFGQLVDTNCAIPVLLVSALLLTGGITALRLPRTKQAELT